MLTWADGGEDLNRVINMAFQKYTLSNPLHPDVFPGNAKYLRKWKGNTT